MLLDLRFQGADLALQGDVGQRVADGEQHAVGVERLLEEVVGAELGGLDRRLDRAVTRDHDDDRVRVLLAQLLQHLEPVESRHLDVEQHQVRPALAVEAERLVAGAGLQHLVALVVEQLLQRGADARLIVHHEDAVAHRGALR